MPANFDPVARLYRYLEFVCFGGALWSRRVAFLPRLKSRTRILLAGEGDGRFLQALLGWNPVGSVDYLDASAQMLALARDRAGADAHRVRFLKADVLSLTQLPGEYDAVVTHFFLDCFSGAELARLIPAIAQSMAPGACWIVSEFQAHPPGAGILLRGLYLFFRITTGLATGRLPDYRGALLSAGFRLEKSEESLAGLLVSEVWVRHEPTSS